MKILVTGSSGFAGEILVPKLEKKGFDVIGLDFTPGKFTQIVHDIAKPIQIENNTDAIIHLAARLEHDRCTTKEYFDANVKGTENLLEFAKKNNSFFIYVSTTAIYGSPKSPIDEKTIISPDGDYATTKYEGEKICEKFKTDDLKISIVRPSVLIGKKRLGIFQIIFKNLFKNSSIPILGNGQNRISFVNIEDFTDFLVFLTEKKIDGITVNFGGKIPGTLNEVIEELIKFTSSESKILHVSLKLIPFLKFLAKLKLIPVTPWQLSVMHKDYFYDNTLLDATGYSYTHEPIDALKDMAVYYREKNL